MSNIPQNQEHPSPDFRQLLRLLSVNRMWLLSTILIALSLAIVVQVLEKRKYISSVVLSYSNSKVSPLNGVSGFHAEDDFLPKMNALIEEFRSNEACQQLVTEVNKAPVSQMGIRSENIDQICGGVQITPDYDKMQVLVRVESLHPFLSQVAADAASVELVVRDRDNMSRKIRTVKKFLAAQESLLGKQLRQLEDEKTQFQAQTSVISIDQAEHSVYESLGKSEQDYFDYEVKLKANESLIRQTQESITQLTKNMTDSQGTVSNLFMNQMQYRLSMLKYRKAMMGAEATPESKRVDDEINSILEKYRELLRDGDKLQASADPLQYLQTLQNSIKSLKKDNLQLKKQIAALEANLKNKSTQIRSLASSIQRLGELSREIEVTTSLYMAVKKRLQEVDIEMAATVSDLSILRQASIGLPENTPLTRKLLFAVAITVFLNIAFFLGRDMFVPTIKDVKEFESFGISAIGYTPLVHISPLKKMPILLREFPDSTEADAFRALRLRVMGLSNTLKKPGKALVVLVTSPLPSSGKTFVASNLAYAFAKSGVKTLLVDFDLRHPSISKFFEVSSASNLDRFFERNEIEDCIINETENLDVVGCSSVTASPADQLEKLILNQFIGKASNKYEMIIMDSPPVLSVIDPFLVAPHANLNLLVVEYRKTHKEDILNSVRQLSILEDTPTVGLINCVLPEMISGDGGAYYRTVQRQDRKDISA